MKIVRQIFLTISFIFLTIVAMQTQASDLTTCAELERNVNTKSLIFKNTAHANQHRCDIKDGQIVDIEVQNSVLTLSNPPSLFCEIKYLAHCALGQKVKQLRCKITIELTNGKQSVPDFAYYD